MNRPLKLYQYHGFGSACQGGRVHASLALGVGWDGVSSHESEAFREDMGVGRSDGRIIGHATATLVTCVKRALGDLD